MILRYDQMPLQQTTLSSLWSAVSAPTSTRPAEDANTLSPPKVDRSLGEEHVALDEQSKKREAATARFGAAPSLPPAASVEPLTQANLLAFRRLIKTLLPVRYPDKTFNEIVTNPHGNVIARVLVWKPAGAPPAACSSEMTRGLVVGAICSRVQPIMSEGADPMPTGVHELYVQMIGVLAPYRSLGLASTLLREVVQTAAAEHGAQTVFAHVWEANEDALEWYRRRGFGVEEDMVQNYYRHLEPHGARIVRRRISMKDFL